MAIKIESGRGGNAHNVIIRDYLSARNYLTEQGGLLLFFVFRQQFVSYSGGAS